MSNTTQEIELHVVIQVGGSSKEYWLHSFLNEAAAEKYIRKAAKASYRCIGPFPMLLPFVSLLA